MLTTIHVTQEHIARGVRMNWGQLPVALAVKSVCLPSIEVSASILLMIAGAGRVKTLDLPLAEWERVCDFDLGRGMFPHSFELDLPAWALPESEAA